MNFIKSVVTGLVVSGVITTLLVGTLFTRLEGTDLDTDKLVFNVSPTTIYDSEGKVLAKFFGDRRSTATYNEIPQEITDAVISTEDRDFYKHSGFSVKAIGRAALEVIKARGNFVQGGSTITQQLVKMTFLTSEKKLERKQQEAIYANILEQKFSKQEILEMYLNRIEYGNHAFGIKDAMMTYFGLTFNQFKKLPREERIIKAAFLAGVPNAPTSYNPYRNPVLAKQRRDVVIQNLRDTNKITEKEYKDTYGKPLMVLQKPLVVFPQQEIKNKELVNLALSEASKRLDKDVKTIMNGGYQIYTSFDTNVYNIIRQEYAKRWNFPSNTPDGTKVESAAVFLNPKNGEVIAFTGGRDIQKQLLDFNRAYQIKKQPGSSIKPLLVYGPALESGKFNPYSSLMDDKGHVFPGNYIVKDSHSSGRSSATMKDALRESLNIPAVWTLQQVGLRYSKEYISKLGIDLSNEKTLGIAIGGLQQGVSPFQMADAYQVFANQGVRTPAHSVREIKDGNNQVIFRMALSKDPTINPENASLMKEMLRNVVSSGTGRAAQVPGRQIAGKTGTNEHPLVKGAANSDVWFVGFDEELLGAVWMGFDKITISHYLTDTSKAPAALFGDLAEKILNYQSKNGKLKDPEEIVDKYTPVDKVSPVITLNGDSTVHINAGEEYKELGATANDNVDGDITSKIKIEGKIDTNKAGEYNVTYSVVDSAGNETKIYRTVSVESIEPTQESLVPVETVTDDVPDNSSKQTDTQGQTQTPNTSENQNNKQADNTVKNNPPSPVQKVITVKPNTNKGVMEISWTLQDGDVSYKLYKNGLLVGNLPSNGYVDFDVQKGKSYEYHVDIIDNKTGAVLGTTNSGNASIQ